MIFEVLFMKTPGATRRRAVEEECGGVEEEHVCGATGVTWSMFVASLSDVSGNNVVRLIAT